MALGEFQEIEVSDGLLGGWGAGGAKKKREGETGVQGNRKVSGIGDCADGGVIIFPGQEIKEADRFGGGKD